MDTEKMSSKEQHEIMTRHLSELATLHKDLEAGAQSWTTSNADGCAAHVYVYLQVDCHLGFPGGLNM